MQQLQELLERQVERGAVPGAVALVAQGDREPEVHVAGWMEVERERPMQRDSVFRIASITKPITAAAVLMLVEGGRIRLDDPIEPWLPELGSRMVVRTPQSPLDDVVSAVRSITVEDLLSSRAGYGFADDFDLPAVQPLSTELGQTSTSPDVGPEEWLDRLSRLPMLAQPGERWLYNTCSDILGLLIPRVTGTELPDFLQERLFDPLGMGETGFWVPERARDRLTALYRAGGDGGLELVDPADGEAVREPVFSSGAGGLMSTVDDWYAFGRMLLTGGEVCGRRLLSEESLRRMMSDHLTQPQRDSGLLFLQWQGWGYGGSVNLARTDPWTVPGRYGWVGGTGTSAYIVPADGSIVVVMTQVELTGREQASVLQEVWACAASALGH